MAARFFVVGGVDTNWSTIGNWSLTSGGAGGQAVPLATDDVTFDANSGSTCTLNTAVRVALSLTTTNYNGALVFTFQLSVSGNITIGANTTFSGAAKLRQIAAGTWNATPTIGVPVEIGGTTTFTSTLAAPLTISQPLTLTNTTSTIFAGAFDITAPSCTISGSQTITLVNDIQINGTTTISDANVINGAFNWKTWGLSMSGGNLTGTAKLVFNATSGNSDWTTPTAFSVANNVDFNCPGSTIRFITNPGQFLTGTMTYVAGTFSGLASNIALVGSSTLDLQGQTISGLAISVAATVTLNSSFAISGTLALPNAAITFAGAGGWTADTVNNTAPTANRTYTLANGVTYKVTNVLDLNGTASFSLTLTSDHATNKANVILVSGADQDCSKVNPTRIDSSGGRPIFTYGGVITTSFNWFSNVSLLLNLPMNRAQTHLGI